MVRLLWLNVSQLIGFDPDYPLTNYLNLLPQKNLIVKYLILDLQSQKFIRLGWHQSRSIRHQGSASASFTEK